MKQVITLLTVLIVAAGLTACGNKPPASSLDETKSRPEQSAPSGTEAADSQNNGKSLVVYFSLPETDDPNGMTREEENSTVVIDGEVLGNTQYVAYIIAENTGAELFRIEPETPYPLDHDTLVDQAQEEQANAVRPAIKGHIDDLTDYETIFFGYPNWWGDMPMILYTFLEEYDLSGKTIIPFNTHGGSGFSDTISAIARLQPDANVLEDGFTVSRSNVAEAREDIISWLSRNGFTN